MDLFNKYEGATDEIIAVDKWIDETYNFFSFSYFDIRGLVKSALDNTLKETHSNCPYSARQIILWAKWNDEKSFLMTAGGQAIQGEAISDKLFGAPVIDPFTEKKNSTAVINGVLLNTVNSAAAGLLYTGLALGAVAVAYQFLSAKARKAGAA